MYPGKDLVRLAKKMVDANNGFVRYRIIPGKALIVNIHFPGIFRVLLSCSPSTLKRPRWSMFHDYYSRDWVDSRDWAVSVAVD